VTRASDPGPEPWELISEHPVYDGWLPVHVRQYRLPDGRECDWEVLKLGDIVSVLRITPEGRVALGLELGDAAPAHRDRARLPPERCAAAGRVRGLRAGRAHGARTARHAPRQRLMTTVDAAYLALDHTGLL
jgi:hypothetical protein